MQGQSVRERTVDMKRRSDRHGDDKVSVERIHAVEIVNVVDLVRHEASRFHRMVLCPKGDGPYHQEQRCENSPSVHWAPPRSAPVIRTVRTSKRLTSNAMRTPPGANASGFVPPFGISDTASVSETPVTPGRGSRSVLARSKACTTQTPPPG